MLESLTMRSQRIRAIIAWTCTVAFGLNAAVLAHGFVQCRNGDGLVRLEWGCERDSAGHCADRCDDPEIEACGDGHEIDHARPAPCEDAPIKPQVISLDRASHLKHMHFAEFAPPVQLAIPDLDEKKSVAFRLVRPLMVNASPPQHRSMRTVVLLV